MIDHSPGLRDLFRVFGSVLPRTLVWAVLGAIEGAICDLSDSDLFQFRNVGCPAQHFALGRMPSCLPSYVCHPHSPPSHPHSVLTQGPKGNGLLELWHHPWSLHVYGMVIGFALVMRVQIAYARFWEGATILRQCTVKLTSAALQILSFDEVGTKAFDESGLKFRIEMVHYASLFHALVLLDVRGDELLADEIALNRADPYLFALKPKDPSRRGSPAERAPSSKSDLHGSGRQPLSPTSTRRCSRAVALAGETGGPRSLRGSGRVTDSASTDASSGRSSGRYSANDDDMRKGVPVPLQSILTARGVLMQADGSRSYNSFEPIDALEASLQGHKIEEPIHIFSAESIVSLSEYIWTTIFLQHSSRSLSKLALTNGFDVVGGVSEEEFAMLRATPSADRSYLVLSWILRISNAARGNRTLAATVPPQICCMAYTACFLSSGIIIFCVMSSGIATRTRWQTTVVNPLCGSG